MKHNFEERKQNRIDYAKDQARKNESKSDALYNQAKSMSSVIPLGQPILVGHHSENRDRNYRNKIHNTYGKAFKTQEKAEYYSDKAETIQNNDSIFSDDPQALDKLRIKLKSLQDSQQFMKTANKFVKKNDREAFLKLPFATESLWQEITKPDRFGGKGFAGFTLQNNNANITRIKSRISMLEKLEGLTNTETLINGIRLVQNTEANRVQLFFTGIPAEEIRKKLKQNGFRWCRSEGAWQRHLTPLAVNIATNLLKNISN